MQNDLLCLGNANMHQDGMMCEDQICLYYIPLNPWWWFLVIYFHNAGSKKCLKKGFAQACPSVATCDCWLQSIAIFQSL